MCGGDTVVKQNQTQRNAMDAAVELTQLYCSLKVVEADKIKDIFTEFYAVAHSLAHANHECLADYLPKELKERITDH